MHTPNQLPRGLVGALRQGRVASRVVGEHSLLAATRYVDIDGPGRLLSVDMPGYAG